MASLQPRGPYSQQELRKLYPDGLQLHQVQVLLRHGERVPTSGRFQNAGLNPFWPYCSVAREMVSATYEANGSKWSPQQWRRRLETFGPEDAHVTASGTLGEVDTICDFGQLTDIGRESTYKLGSRLRHLYVDQLKFMPATIQNADMIYLRATPMPRSLESLQQAFWGLYPSSMRPASFPPLTIVTRTASDETLYPNDSACRRFAQLSKAFAQRTADRWNKTDEMEYLNKLIGKWMPEASKKVAVDGRPRLSGIMDTVNATIAHGPETKLPKEFYDKKSLAIRDRIALEEWYSGYKESQEYRTVGIGAQMGDIVSRMVQSVGKSDKDGSGGLTGSGNGNDKAFKFAMCGCHDTTLAAVLTSLGAFEGEEWPKFTSHIALEVFKNPDAERGQELKNPTKKETMPVSTTSDPKAGQGWIQMIFGGSSGSPETEDKNDPVITARRKVTDLKAAERAKLDGYFVRIRYNDKVMTVPGCKAAGKHLDGDESFCTLEAFKTIVDKYTPSNWKQACKSNLGAAAFPKSVEPAGY